MKERLLGILELLIGTVFGTVLGAWFTYDVQVRELELKQAEQMDKYIEAVTDESRLQRRRDLALFFSEVPISEKMRAGWGRYLKIVAAELEAARKREELIAEEVKSLEADVNSVSTAAKVLKLSELNEEKEDLRLKVDAKPSQLTPRIYIHIQDESQRNLGGETAKVLYRARFLVPGIQLLSTGPESTELRYFRSSEESVATEIADLIRTSVMPPIDITARYIPGHEKSARIREKHFELWMGVPRR